MPNITVISHQQSVVSHSHVPQGLISKVILSHSKLTLRFRENITREFVNDCLSYSAITWKRHHDQGNSQKKAINWGLASTSRVLVHDHHGSGYGGRQEGMKQNSS